MNKDFISFTAPRARVLLTEDNPVEQKIALILLEPLDIQIDTADNGRAALDMVLKKRYDLIFMDYMMPVMDGIETAMKIRRMEGGYFKRVPIIGLTAGNRMMTKDKCLEAGMSDYLLKPIVLDEIREKIKFWLPDRLIKPGPMSIVKPEVDTGPQVDLSLLNLSLLKGIDAEEGIRRTGSKELYIEILSNVHRQVSAKAVFLENLINTGLLRRFTVEAHSLANTARLIGSDELYQMFCLLEDLGGKGDLDALKTQAPLVIESYRNLKPILEPFVKVRRKAWKKITREELEGLIKGLRAAMECFNLDEADRIMEELNTFLVPEECLPYLETLGAHMANVAIQDVLELTERFLKQSQVN